MRNVLLLTATVTPPPGVPSLQRTDPVLRLQDYKQAFEFYLPLIGTTFDSIVFAENSASDITPLRQLSAKAKALTQVEFLSFNGLDHPASYGRGYGEFKLVDYAMEHAAFLQGDVCVWKCTGRYKVKNITDLVNARPAGADIYCHFRNYPHPLCELFLLSFTTWGFSSVVKGSYARLRNDVIPGVHSNEEIGFRKLIESLPPSFKVVRRFNRTPIVDARRGWDNTNFSGTWHPKIMLRRAARVLAPWVWI